MSQRDSGYERKERDVYETPGWVTEALVPHIPTRVMDIWEPAAATGKMVAPLKLAGYSVHSTDIDHGVDFLAIDQDVVKDFGDFHAIITNPPYEVATEFIDHALKIQKRDGGVVAMLLRTDFDHAKTRSRLFSSCRAFAKKVVLTKHIKWFEDSKGSPSFNHAWFIWDWKHSGPPTLAYGPASGLSDDR